MKTIKKLCVVSSVVLAILLTNTANAVDELYWRTSSFSVSPVSKTCIIPQDGVSTTCDMTFNWSVSGSTTSGTLSEERYLTINGALVPSELSTPRNYYYMAQIPLGSTSYALLGVEDDLEITVDGAVTASYGDYTPLFTHSPSTHKSIIGDFDGNGQDDTYFQPKLKGVEGGLMPVISNEFLDANYHKSWTSSHPQISAIEDWSEGAYGAFAGNFNSNPGDELLLLGTKQLILLHGDIITPIMVYQPVNNAIVSWNGSQTASHAEFEFEFDANPADFEVHIGDLSGDGYDEIFLQAKLKGGTSYILSNTGALIQTINNGYRNMEWSAASYSAEIMFGKIALTALNSADDDNEAYTNSSGVIISLQTPVTKPTITGSSDKYVFEGLLYSFIPDVSSSISNLTFSVTGKPSWMSLNTSTGELSGTPSTGDTGQSHSITLTVHENKSHTVDVSISFNINVEESFQISQTGYSVYEAADGTLYLLSDNGVDVYKIVEDGDVIVILRSSISEFNALNTTLLDGHSVQFGDFNGDGNIDLWITPPIGSNMEAYLINDVNSLYHNVTFSTPERDLVSDAVGATSGSFAVDEGGQANYSIPIYAPAGVAGVTPSLSLNYNSGGGNGIVGLGWNIGGLSAVSRCAKSLLVDGKQASVNLNNNDRFCLDGQRLVLVSGNYGEPESEYRTYPDSKVKVIAKGIAGDGPSYFKVWRSDGSFSEYGSTESSKLRGNDKGTALLGVVVSWSQSFSEDRYSNRINYHYDKDEYTSSSYLNRVSYADDDVEISFQYDARPDHKIGYFQGGKNALLERLTSIQVKDQDIEVRKYDLAYEISDSDQSRLVSVTESKDGVSLQPTTFDWADAEKGIIKDYTHHRTPVSNNTFSHINFDNDMTPEGFSLGGSGKKVGLGIYEYAGTGDNLINELVCSGSSPDFESEHVGGGHRDPWYRFPFDLNGDGVDEVLVVLPELQSIASEKTYFYWYDQDNNIGYDIYDYQTVWDSNLYAVFADDVCSGNVSVQFLGNVETGTAGYGDPAELEPDHNFETGLTVDNVYFGDIDGDLLPDFVYERSDNVYVRYHLGDAAVPSTNYYSDEIELLAYDINDNEVTIERIYNNRSGDFNADGRLDIFLRSNGVWSLYLSTYQNGEIVFKEHLVIGELGGQKKPSFQIVDINSDGLLDIVYKDSSEGDWQYSLNTGKEFVGPITTHVSKSKSIWFLDHNENGKREIVFVHNARVRYSEYISNNSFGYFSNTFHNLGVGGPEGGLIGDFIHLVDFDGDGSLDINSVEIVQHTLEEDDYEHYYNLNKTPFEVRDRISVINNGLGNVTNIDYRLLTDPESEELYDLDSGWYFDNGHVVRRQNSPMAVVEQVASSAPSYSNVDNKNGISYRYGNYKVHQKFGGLGFEWLETTDLQTGVVTRTTYHQAFPYIGQPSKTEVWYGNFETLDDTSQQTRLMSQATRDYETKVVGQYFKDDGSQADLIFPYLSNSHEQGWYFDLLGMQQQEKISQTVSEFEYNSLGYQIESNVYNCHGFTVDCNSTTHLKRTQTESEYYLDNDDDWIRGRLKNTTVSHYRSGQATRVRESAFEYDLLTGILTAEEIQPDSTNVSEYLRTQYEHDDYGNVIRTSTCSYGISCLSESQDNINDPYFIHRVTHSEFDAKGRYLTRTLNGYGQVTSEVISRNELGQPIRVKDIFGNESHTRSGTFGQTYFAIGANGNWSVSINRLCADVICPSGAITKITNSSADGSSGSVYKNALGQTLQTESIGFDGQLVIQMNRYNDRGLLYETSQPHYEGELVYWTETEFDNLNRIKKVTSPDTGVSETFYEGYDLSLFALITRESNPLYQDKTEYKNALGELVQAVDNDGNRLNYSYSVFGDLTNVYLNDVEQSSIGYDDLGRKTSMMDQDKGGQNNKDWNYAYNALGELVEQTDAKEQKQLTYYDRAGRTFRKTSYDVDTNLVRDERWDFDNTLTVSGNTGQLITQYDVVNSELVVEPKYDHLGRIYLTETTIGNTTFASSTQYDLIGRGYRSIDASGKGTESLFNARGYLTSIKDLNSSLAYQTIQSMDAYGNVTNVILGNGASQTRGYDNETGRLISIDTTKSNQVIQSLYYTWDLIGRLRERVDNSQSGNNQSEIFDYDSLNRVTHVNGESRYNYDETGNITWKKDIGDYIYGETCDGVQAGHHAVTSIDSASYCYDLNGNMLSGDGRSIEYTTFDKANSITKGSHTTEFAYGPNRSRYKRVDTNSQGVTTTYYLGGVEYIIKPNGSIVHRRNVNGAVVEESSSGSQVHYLHRDHLGSTDAITNASGTVVQNVSFDAFGEKRVSINWNTILNTPVYGPSAITSFGYTGHEMADEVGIIHMTGRIYDPKLGRFMQADPMIDGATDSQGYNRYTYVRNNPLAYTDPTGFLKTTSFLKRTRKWLKRVTFGASEKEWFGPVANIGCLFTGPAASACMAGVAGATTISGGGNLAAGLNAAGRAYAIGEISMGAAEGIGGAFPTMVNGVSASLPVVFEAAIAHGILGGAMSMVQGGRFGHGFFSAFGSKFAGSYIHPTDSKVFTSKESRIVMAGLIGGTISDATGGKFANGAAQSALQWAFNAESGHSSTDEVEDYQPEYSPVSGIFETEEGLVIALYVTDAGLVDETGSVGYGFDPKTGLARRQGDLGRVVSVAPDAYLLGGSVFKIGANGLIKWLPSTLGNAKVGHRLFTATRKNGSWNTGKLRIGWSGKNGSDVYKFMIRYKKKHYSTGIKTKRDHPNP